VRPANSAGSWARAEPRRSPHPHGRSFTSGAVWEAGGSFSRRRAAATAETEDGRFSRSRRRRDRDGARPQTRSAPRGASSPALPAGCSPRRRRGPPAAARSRRQIRQKVPSLDLIQVSGSLPVAAHLADRDAAVLAGPLLGRSSSPVLNVPSCPVRTRPWSPRPRAIRRISPAPLVVRTKLMPAPRLPARPVRPMRCV